MFYSSAYGTGGALLALRAEGGEVRAQEKYFTREMQNHHGGLVLVNGYLYGFNNSILTCMEFATGKDMWRHRSVGKGSLTYADGHLYILSENNVVGLAEATPPGTVRKAASRLPIRIAIVGPSRRERRAAVSAESGYSYRLRHQRTVSDTTHSEDPDMA